MKIKIKTLSYALLSLLFLLNSCGTTNRMMLPYGNIDKDSGRNDSINTAKDEVAPYRILKERDCSQTINKERIPVYEINKFAGIRPSYCFIRDMISPKQYEKNKIFYDNFTQNVESVTFQNELEGFVSFSHPPTAEYANLNHFSITGTQGGTDIFHFENKGNGEMDYQNLGSEINSKFWDSHPFVGNDENCNLVLVWASDRNAPFSEVYNDNGDKISIGNTDLYYCFKKDGTWGEVKQFNKVINTEKYNELSPFIACLDKEERLLFASNREGSYDVFHMPIKVDFENQEIQTTGSLEIFEKGDSLQKSNINTSDDELFPFVAKNNNDQIRLFLSSNRNSKGIMNSGFEVKSKGSYDIYEFDYPFGCSASTPKTPKKPVTPITPTSTPTIRLNIYLRDVITNKDVLEPVISVTNMSNNDSDDSYEYNKQSVENIILKPEMKYSVSGYSRWTSKCDSMLSNVLTGYKAKKITKIGENITSRKVKIEYDTIVGGKQMMTSDTTIKTELCALQDMQKRYQKLANKVYQEDNAKISINEMILEAKEINYVAKDSLKRVGIIDSKDLNRYNRIITRTIKIREWVENAQVLKQKRDVVIYDTIPKNDTTMIEANSEAGRNFLTRSINTDNITKDTIINVIFELYPQYFEKTPCKYEYVSSSKKFANNLPYYQTAFWEVNTEEGLKKHHNAMLKDGVLSARKFKFIELHPSNTRYGVAKKDTRHSCKTRYAKYAEEVDKKLKGMSDTITKVFIPALDYIDYTNKILINLEALSDIRDASLCHYFGKQINYIEGEESEAEQIIKLNTIKIEDNANLGADNDTLSKLRVYFGWLELYKLLQKDKKFKEYEEKDLVFHPTLIYNSQKERNEALKKAKIIILAKGRGADPVTKNNDKDYDPIRRMNLVIKMITYDGERVLPSKCCDPKKNNTTQK